MAKRRRLKMIHVHGPGHVSLVIGGTKDWITLHFMVDREERLILYLRWAAKTKKRGAPVGKLTIMRTFPPKTAEAVMRGFLRFAGYQLETMTGKQRRDLMRHCGPEHGIELGKFPSSAGGIYLFLTTDSGIGYEFTLQLTKTQLAAICEHIAPALGWDLT